MKIQEIFNSFKGKIQYKEIKELEFSSNIKDDDSNLISFIKKKMLPPANSNEVLKLEKPLHRGQVCTPFRKAK